jgi:hypothetical protein
VVVEVGGDSGATEFQNNTDGDIEVLIAPTASGCTSSLLF